jgi:hypothetical protein
MIQTLPRTTPEKISHFDHFADASLAAIRFALALSKLRQNSKHHSTRDDMLLKPLPRDLHRAPDCLRADPEHPWTLVRLAAPRTLQLAGRNDEGRHTLVEPRKADRELTIADVRSGLPWHSNFRDRVAEGLETAGMRP